MKQVEFERDFFVYVSTVASLAAAASDSDTVNIEASSDFILRKMTMFADIAGAVQTDSSRVLPLISVQITDTGAGKQLFTDAIPIPSLFGSGTIPFILPSPRIFARNSTISVAYENYSAATTYANIYLNFIGEKVYKGRVKQGKLAN